MRNIELRTDIRTTGGEISDIMIGGHYVGTLTLVYREGDRVAGSAQIEEESLKSGQKTHVIDFLRRHIQSLTDGMNAESCDVIVTCGTFDTIVTSAPDELFAPELEEQPQKVADEQWDSAEYELVTVNEKRNRIDYQIYDNRTELVADAFFTIRGADVSGEVRWVHQPTDEEVALITELLVTDFDEDTVDSFDIDHQYDGNPIETVELTHEDLLDTPVEMIGDNNEDDYSIVLARDDGDVLTFQIYKQSDGGLPIGTATVDLESRRLTGYIDFRDQRNIDDAEAITALLLRELDKEREYDGLNLSLMHDNQLIDEIVIENEPVH